MLSGYTPVYGNTNILDGVPNYFIGNSLLITGYCEKYYVWFSIIKEHDNEVKTQKTSFLWQFQTNIQISNIFHEYFVQ